MGVLHIVFGELPLVFHLLAAEQIQGEGFLEDGVTHVLLVLQDVPHRVVAPLGAAPGGLAAVRHQVAADLAHALPHQVPGEDAPHRGGLLLINLRLPVLTLAITQEVVEVVVDDALLEPGAVAPLDVGGHGLTLRLGLAH